MTTPHHFSRRRFGVRREEVDAMSDKCNVRDCERQVEYVLMATPDRRTGSLGARLCALHYARKNELIYLDNGEIVGPGEGTRPGMRAKVVARGDEEAG